MKRKCLALFLLFALVLTSFSGCGVIEKIQNLVNPTPKAAELQEEPTEPNISVEYPDGVGLALLRCEGRDILVSWEEDLNPVSDFLKGYDVSALDDVVFLNSAENLNTFFADFSVKNCYTVSFSLPEAVQSDVENSTVLGYNQSATLGRTVLKVLGNAEQTDGIQFSYGNDQFFFLNDFAVSEETSTLLETALPNRAICMTGDSLHFDSAAPLLSTLSPAFFVAARSMGDLSDDFLQLLSAGNHTVLYNENGSVILSGNGEALSSAFEKSLEQLSKEEETATAESSKAPDETEETSEPRLLSLGTSPAYIGNKNTKKFHYSTCHWLPKEENRVLFDTREEAIQAGYQPCGKCKP